jgi:SAM-dependent methyltransferase
LRVLDIGCSTGNLLAHLKDAFPDIRLAGGDLFHEVIERCRARPELAGVALDVMDVRAMPSDRRFDLVIANAVLYRFSASEFEACCIGIARVLDTGGWLVAWDWYHPFNVEVRIIEESKWHPSGLALHMRSYAKTRTVLTKVGFEEVRFQPFELPIDLPQPEDMASLATYTRRDENGVRLQFRGPLCQPWCHVIARKA